MEDCLKLLKGERDEQLLAGLLLATKFCKGDNHASIMMIYNAMGVQFLDRPLQTGMGKGVDRDGYLQLSISLLPGICRVDQIAASKDMVSKIPSIFEILRNYSSSSSSLFVDECYEFLFLVASASEDGVTTLYESMGLEVLSSHMSSLPDGSHSLELSMKLVKLMVRKMPLKVIFTDYPSELSLAIVSIAKHFALLHNALKFEALHLLSALLSSEHSGPLHDTLRLMKNCTWAAHIRVGIVAILQNRVSSVEKFQALVLAESLISTLGESWLIDHTEENALPDNRCLLLVLESSRVEVAVLLNELAYFKYEGSNSYSAEADETISQKQRNLAVAFSLIEKIIKLISNVSEWQGGSISESTTMKVIAGLNETVGVVLEFLKDAKDHGQRKENDLLASVRLVGSYLAEAPFACKEAVRDILDYILSVEDEDEPGPFYSICFMLPMLCQMTMETEGSRILASVGGLKAIVECLVKLIDRNRSVQSEDTRIIFLACDTLLNVLLKQDKNPVQLDISIVIRLLRAMAFWTENINDITIITMASSICSLMFNCTSEDALLRHPDFKLNTHNSLSQMFARSLQTSGFEFDVTSDEAKAELDLQQIVTARYTGWADRFPHIKQVVNRATVSEC